MKSVAEYLDASAKAYPDKIVFQKEDSKMTYLSFQEKAHRIASCLIQNGYYKAPVLILMDKSIECLATFFGVVYSGNFYTPVDCSMPASRTNNIVEVLQPAIIITEIKHEKTARQLNSEAKLLIYEDIIESEPDYKGIQAVEEKVIDTDILYVLFTSGSTGTPKGVIINHRSVIDYIDWAADTFQLDSSAVIGNQVPFYFDVSVHDIFSTIKTGATMNIIPPEYFAFPARLLQYMKKSQINTILWVPSALCNVANLNALSMEKEGLPDLKLILFLGEVMPNKQLNMWRTAYNDTTFVNLYGPTETTVASSYYIVDRAFDDSEPLPIGKACQNTDILILTDEDKPAKQGEAGELCIRGSSLAMGYYNNPQKTSEAFVQNPLNPYYPEIIYRTGDLVKHNERNEILFLSRKDFQIKYQGHRIELGEIETAASSIDGVHEAVCLYNEAEKRIVLFYNGQISGDDILSELKKKLAKYMIPKKVIFLENIPKNLNGKTDRPKLKELL